MRNQPKYNFFKNSSYALNGLKNLIKTETSFKIELLVIIPLLVLLFFLDLSLAYKLLMFMSLMLVLLCEAINSSIERVVDLVTKDYNKLAGLAKDVGSTVVFISIFIASVTWLFILFENYF